MFPTPPNGYFAAISPKPTGAVTIPSALGGKPVTSIGDYAFKGCSELTEVTIPSGITSIGNSTFSGCRDLSEVSIPGSVTTINGRAFDGCESLTTLVIPEGVVSLDSDVFYRCSNLLNVSIPSTVTNMAILGESSLGAKTTNPFLGAANVAVTIDRRNPMYHMSSGQIVSSDGNLVSAFLVSGKAVIPSDVTRIGHHAFGQPELTSITIPAHVTDIEYYAFAECSEKCHI